MFLLFLKKVLYGTIPYSISLLFNPQTIRIKYYRYIKEHGYTHHPYPFAEKYLNMKVDAFWDKSKELPYILHKGRKLYFPRNFSLEQASGLYRALSIEQDQKSAHLYVENIGEIQDKILLDVGAAEGILALEAADIARRIYLFEYDDAWIEALTATFEPYKDKTEIVKMFVSDSTNEVSLALDDFCKGMYKEPLFLKMDIEGEELKALEGSKSLFRKAEHIDFAICAYHKKNHARKIADFLDKYQCQYELRKGFFYVKHSFRVGLLRGLKSIK